MRRAFVVFSGDVELLVHFLAETAAVLHLGGDGSELLGEVDFEEVKHGVKGDEELIFGVFPDVLDEEIVAGEFGGDEVEVYAWGKGHEELYLLLVHI